MKKLKILHLNSNFLFTKIYENQINSMSNEFKHVIYNPLKSHIDNNSGLDVLHPENLNKFDSLLTLRRLSKSFRYIKRKVDLRDIDIIHAHTMSNDGLLAWKLYKKYNIPYILTIRNTDINFTLRYKKHLKKHFYKVLISANIIIFPNYSYKLKLMNYYKNDVTLEKKLKKAIEIPNGIHKMWNNNPTNKIKKKKKKKVKVLFVGRIYRNKNLHNLLEAIEKIDNCELTVIGKIIDSKYFNDLSINYNLNYIGEKNKEEILDIMKNHHIFAMPSFNETFGLVYIEALSQNLPILYTKNEGIYNYFPEYRFGIAVNPNQVDEIRSGIEWIVNNYEKIQENLTSKAFLEEFDWNNIGKYYESIYLGGKNE